MMNNLDHPCYPHPERVLPAMVKPVVQQTIPRTYDNDQALLHGTLFPCLWKPLHNEPLPIPARPMDKDQAFEFVWQEILLFLDTHPRYGEYDQQYQQMCEQLIQRRTERLKNIQNVKEPWEID